MKVRVIASALALLLLSSFGTFAKDEPKKEAPKPAPMKLKVGDMAPDFTLLAFDGKDLKPYKLSDFRGKKNVVVAFYVFAFTGG